MIMKYLSAVALLAFSVSGFCMENPCGHFSEEKACNSAAVPPKAIGNCTYTFQCSWNGTSCEPSCGGDNSKEGCDLCVFE